MLIATFFNVLVLHPCDLESASDLIGRGSARDLIGRDLGSAHDLTCCDLVSVCDLIGWHAGVKVV